MEVNFTPEIERKLNDLATLTGRGANELVQDAVIGYVDEFADTRSMLDGRYNDIRSGRVKPIDGEEAFARLMAKTEAERKHPA